MAFDKRQEINENKVNSSKKTLDYSPFVLDRFLKDWENCRDRHSGQKAILDAFFEEDLHYIFIRAGRKFSKTSTKIDIAWKFAMMHPNSVIYYGFPTITQAIEVVWEEKRLQRCDLKSDEMFDKYVIKTDDSKHILTLCSGSFIKLIGTWSEARGRGTQPDLLIMDEIQDCSESYLDAADPNLAAKDGYFVMGGTPPAIENHYHSWERRIANNPRGRTFHFPSYSNDKLPHLKEWLDNKKEELIRSGKEDVWLREYMAQDCFSSSDRMLPDAQLKTPEEVNQIMGLHHYANRFPVLAISVQPHYICAIMSVIIPQRSIFITGVKTFRNTWKKSVAEIYPELKPQLKELQDLCGKKMQNIVWDESKSFQDIIIGFTSCRKDTKWQDRGFLLLREMMTNNKMHISNALEEFGPECQRLLRNEPIKEIESNYPHVCTIAMLVNEFFQIEKLMVKNFHKFDQYEALREAGIPVAPKRNKTMPIFRIGD